MGNSPARTVGPNSHRSAIATLRILLKMLCLLEWVWYFCQLIMAEFSRREKTPALLLQTRSGL